MRLSTGSPGVRIWLGVVLVLTSLGTLIPEVAQAVVLNQSIVRLDNLTTGTTSTGSVCITPHVTHTTNVNFVLVQFPSAFTIATTSLSTNWATSVSPPAGLGSGQDYWPSGANNWPAALTPTAATGSPTNTVTFSFGPSTMTAGSMYCFRWTNAAAITSTGAAASGGVDTGSVTIQDSTPTTLESNNYALTILSPSDNVAVNATVPPIFSFTLSTNSINVPAGGGNLDYTVVNHSDPVDAAVTTNAKGGWIMWAEDSNQGLTSTSTSAHIPSVTWVTGPNDPSTLSPGTSGTPGNALAVTVRPAATTYCSTSNLTVDPEYDTAEDPGTDGGPLTANFAEIGTCSGNVSNGDGFRLIDNVAITPITPAATDYQDVITVVGAGNF